MSLDAVSRSASDFMLACLAHGLRDEETDLLLGSSAISYKFNHLARTYADIYSLHFRIVGSDGWRFCLRHLSDEAEAAGLVPLETWCNSVETFISLTDQETRTQFRWSLLASAAAQTAVPGSAKRPAKSRPSDVVGCLDNYTRSWHAARFDMAADIVPQVGHGQVLELVDELLANYTLSEVAHRATGLRLLAAQTGLACNIHSLDFERSDKSKLLAYLVSRLIGSTRGLVLPSEVPEWAQKFLEPCTSA